MFLRRLFFCFNLFTALLRTLCVLFVYMFGIERLSKTNNLIIILVDRELHGSKNVFLYMQPAVLLEFLKGACLGRILQHHCSLAAKQLLVLLARRQKSFLYWSCDSSVSLQRPFFFFTWSLTSESDDSLLDVIYCSPN